jgi:ABC-type Fe3+-hydroxamate transport system substrate-binding protein
LPKLKGNIFIIVVILFALLLTACTVQAPNPTPSPVPAPAPSPVPETERESPAIITDSTGREWDVTHARDVYNMNPDYFNYGLGIGAIPSVDEPTVLEEGDPGYPDPDSPIHVFGVNHNGEQRAYSVSALSRHEVFNDVYAGESNQYVAVTY